MTPAELAEAIRSAVAAAAAAGEIDVEPPASVTVERPRQKAHGDYATNVALQLAKQAGKPPRAVAEVVATRLREAPAVAGVEIAGPGFLNITLAAAAAGAVAGRVVEAGEAYGRNDSLAGQRIDLEFVSANPTGPLHLGHVRWAAVGDCLGRLLSASGATVTREFYINDQGAQMDKFAASIRARALGQEPPEDGYQGAYVADLAKAVLTARPDILDLPEGEQLAAFREEGYRAQLAEQQATLDSFRTHFDVWFSERTLHAGGGVERAVETLRAQGHIEDRDGAVWLRTTDFGDDKDRVLIRADGVPTYFAADAAYYLDKRARGYDTSIYMLGADHHGYVARLKAIAACAGDDPERAIEILIGQFVKVVQGGGELRLSKRAGNVVTLEDVVELAGVDAIRYSLARSSTDSTLVLDIDLLTKQANDNPVFYVQYAHARIASVLRNAAEHGLQRGESYDAGLLDHERENDLLRALAEFPRVVATAAELREVHRVARYLEALAGTYHRFYDACRVLPMGDEEPGELNRARLWLCEATRQVLANGLALLGVSAPERM
ncbi:arginyl-tRNA synthetase [Motilibacter rhizosphaerae]|uniref:Arginine--tRNA ligase n=1 Tax=Motilibacter rhizosphaerae TaxID=598652 RepID=A0A4Q7NR72_9ACTN|nr:arginine--tRNA ligase [Motilibacter rhizosphaerae]RZS87120.1 arginyl-tRNA synthetase [Motilibacter rhizosphaerae]